MKSYETFAQWAADQHAHQKKMISAVRKLVRKTSPTLVESVKWGNGVWLGKEWPVAFLHAKDDHLQFGFFGGSGLSDPKGLLKGNGKHIRHLKVFVPGDIDTTAFARLIRQATRHERE